jgi:hypothetical protein
MAQGDGIPLRMAIDMTRACTPFPHARSLSFPRLGFPSSAARFCSSYILGAFGVWRFSFFFHSAGWILRSRRFRLTRLIFISFLFPGSDVQGMISKGKASWSMWC